MMACLMVSVTLAYHLYKDILVSCDFFSYLFLTERLNVDWISITFGMFLTFTSVFLCVCCENEVQGRYGCCHVRTCTVHVL